MPLRRQSEAISRAVDSPTASVQDMGVNHRRAYILVAQQLLDGPDVVTILEEVGGKGTPPRVAAARNVM